jgi:CRISPR-associated protein Cmr6
MPIAAVPTYLGNDFRDASPALRFGLLLPIWTNRQDQEREVNKRAEAISREGDEVRTWLRQGMDNAIHQLRRRQQRPLPGLWDKNDFAARDAWKNIRALTPTDRGRMKGLADRQSALSAAVPAEDLLRLDAQSAAPFTTGLGNEHPLENGFAFLNPYGLPYLPGAGVKGVLRQAARELASGEWGDTHGWSVEPKHTLMQGEGDKRHPVLDSRKQPVMLSLLDVLFGRETSAGDSDHVHGALGFWDVIPQIKGDSLAVEIMTPHQSHYYQQKRDRKSGDSMTPHESGQPNPISFLTVPPGSGFAFHVVCDHAHLRRLAPDLVELGPDGQTFWKSLLTAAFEHAFDWLGFGAKTAVGYGAMQRDTAAEARAAKELADREAEIERLRHEAENRARREAELAQLSPIERAIREFLDQRPDKNQAEISAVIGAIKQGRWTGEEKRQVAGWLEAAMRSAKQWRESSQAKKPEKDREYQNTLLVRGWLEGK